MTKEYLVTPPPYDLSACNDFYDLARKNSIPPAALEAITKIARAWTREPRFGGEDPILRDLYAAQVALRRQIEIEECRYAQPEVSPSAHAVVVEDDGEVK